MNQFTLNTDFFSLGLIFAGFIIGLGAVTVIDIHGFLAQKSKYWTESTIRTHKVTKPLIWLGILLLSIGKIILYQTKDTTYVNELDLILISTLIINGCFLSFNISPKLLAQEKAGKIAQLLPTQMQNKIKVSFIFSVIGWWGLFLLTIFRITQNF